MKRQLIVAAMVGALALAGCSAQPVDTTAEEPAVEDETDETEFNKYQLDVESVMPVSLGWMDFSVPRSWDTEQDGWMIDLVPSVGGLAQVSMSAGIDFASDGSEEVDELLDSLDDGVMRVVSDKREGLCGNARTYTVDVERSDPSGLYKGYAEFIISGHALYMFYMVVPESDFDAGYDEVLQAILDSATIEGSVAPLGADDQSAEQNDPAEPSPSDETPATIGEGTHLVGTDIEAGEYKLTATSDIPGYWKVTESSAPDADIIGNDNFNGSAYVTVTEGQYLTLSRCTGEKVG